MSVKCEKKFSHLFSLFIIKLKQRWQLNNLQKGAKSRLKITCTFGRCFNKPHVSTNPALPYALYYYNDYFQRAILF